MEQPLILGELCIHINSGGLEQLTGDVTPGRGPGLLLVLIRSKLLQPLWVAIVQRMACPLADIDCIVAVAAASHVKKGPVAEEKKSVCERTSCCANT